MDKEWCSQPCLPEKSSAHDEWQHLEEDNGFYIIFIHGGKQECMGVPALFTIHTHDRKREGIIRKAGQEASDVVSGILKPADLGK